jgi:O-acetylhomoserine (thiol)-lyase
MTTKKYTNPATIALHAGWRKDETTNSVTVPNTYDIKLSV